MASCNFDRQTLPQWSTISEIESILPHANPEELPGFIDRGSTFYVYDIGDNLVAKLPLVQAKHEFDLGFGWGSAESTVELSAALIQGVGHSGLEQIVEFSPANPSAIVCKKAPGDTCQNISGITLPTAHVSSLIDAAKDAHNLGLSLDFELDNVMYSSNEGFTLIDYELSHGKQSLIEKLSYLSHLVISMSSDPAQAEHSYQEQRHARFTAAEERFLVDEQIRQNANNPIRFRRQD